MTPVIRQSYCSACAALPCRLVYFEAQSLQNLCDNNHDIGFIIMKRLANVVASWALTAQLQLYDMIIQNK